MDYAITCGNYLLIVSGRLTKENQKDRHLITLDNAIFTLTLYEKYYKKIITNEGKESKLLNIYI